MSELTRELLQLVAETSLKESFIEGYPETQDHLLDALGIAIARYCNWAGLDILKIMYGALEDANYHTINQTVRKWIDREG
jgi:hypothetical protein